MLKLQVTNKADQHVVVTSTEPCRVEVSVANGSLILYGYKGAEADTDQDPDVLYVTFPSGPDYMLGDVTDAEGESSLQALAGGN